MHDASPAPLPPPPEPDVGRDQPVPRFRRHAGRTRRTPRRDRRRRTRCATSSARSPSGSAGRLAVVSGRTADEIVAYLHAADSHRPSRSRAATVSNCAGPTAAARRRYAPTRSRTILAALQRSPRASRRRRRGKAVRCGAPLSRRPMPARPATRSPKTWRKARPPPPARQDGRRTPPARRRQGRRRAAVHGRALVRGFDAGFPRRRRHRRGRIRRRRRTRRLGRA